MSRRIVGQCSISDFKHLDHLSDWMARGGELDVSSLTKRQSVAIMVLHEFQKCGYNLELCLKLKEVLVWEDDSGRNFFEYKLLDRHDRETFDKLRFMTRR